MTRAEPHPHHPHLPYREWGGGGAGEMARMADHNMIPWWGFREAGWFARWTIARVRTAIYRRCRRRTALVEWIGTGLTSRSQEFDPPRPIHRHIGRRHYDLDGHVSNDRGMYQGRGGVGACLSIDNGHFSPFVGRRGNGVRHVLKGVATYLGLTQ